ncbi:MAG: hypothetical protein ACYTFY_09510 [Planctomycetota bacterium]|jgi:hypothetical protein
MKQYILLILTSLLSISALNAENSNESSKPKMIALIKDAENKEFFPDLVEFNIEISIYASKDLNSEGRIRFIKELSKAKVLFLKSRLPWREIIEYHALWQKRKMA